MPTQTATRRGFTAWSVSAVARLDVGLGPIAIGLLLQFGLRIIFTQALQ